MIRAPHLERGLKPLGEFPAADGPQTFFSQGLRQYVFVEQEVAPQPFQPAVFFFELPEPTQLAYGQLRVLHFPGVEGGVTHPKLSAQVADRGAGFRLPDRVHNLFFRER